MSCASAKHMCSRLSSVLEEKFRHSNGFLLIWYVASVIFHRLNKVQRRKLSRKWMRTFEFRRHAATCVQFPCFDMERLRREGKFWFQRIMLSDQEEAIDWELLVCFLTRDGRVINRDLLYKSNVISFDSTHSFLNKIINENVFFWAQLLNNWYYQW